MSNTFTADSQYALVLGDLGPPLVVTLKTSSNGSQVAPFVLEDGDVVTLRYLDPNGAEHDVALDFDAGSNIVTRHWQSGDLPVLSGGGLPLYRGQIRVVRSGEDFPQTFPDTGYITWQVTPAIDGSAPTAYGELGWLDVPTYYATGSEGVGVAVTIPTPQTMAQTDYKVFAIDRGAGRYEFSIPLVEQTETSFVVYFAAQPPAGTPFQFAIFGRHL